MGCGGAEETMSPTNKSHRPVVSCVIVNYETSDMVRRCVKSLLQQIMSFEIIVVDNPSPAEDVKHLEDLPLRLIRNPVNTGYGAGCNEGAAAARGSYICILNPDTALPPDELKKWVEVFRREKSRGRRIGLLAPRLVNENGTVQRSVYQFVNPLNYWLYHSILAGALKKLRKTIPLGSRIAGDDVVPVDWVMGAAMLIPRPVWDAVYGFDKRFFLYGEDADLCRRLRKAGYETAFAPEVAIVHSQGEPSAERRGASAVRLFMGIRQFMRHHYSAPKRLAE